MTHVIVAHPDDDILFFAPELFKAKNLSITYVYAVSRLRLLGVRMAHLLTGLHARRIYLQLPWDHELAFTLDSEETWTHDPGDYRDHHHHWNVAEAVLRAAKGRVRLFTGYSLPDAPLSVYGWDYARKALMWRIYSLFDPAVRHMRTHPFHVACLGRCQSVYA